MDKDKNNNFTPRARKVVELARAEARRFNHNYVGTEHILLGLIELGEGVAVNVLRPHAASTSRPSAALSRSRSALVRKKPRLLTRSRSRPACRR
jgi:ATP-dependent Clp protease ATP-binding subunit ClpA